MLIGLVGFAGSGKGTVGDILVNKYEFTKISFADALKDAVSVIFGWDRSLLEGDTIQSRAWREQPDAYWSKKFGKEFSPRQALQLMGTEAGRGVFGDTLWVSSLEKRLDSDKNYVIADVRFPNEIKAIQKAGGKVFRINRGPLPDWYDYALAVNRGPRHIGWALSKDQMAKLKIHPSEWSWIGRKFDAELDNNGTFDSLFDQLKNLVQDLPGAKGDPAS
jgi:hypothetical protein